MAMNWWEAAKSPMALWSAAASAQSAAAQDLKDVRSGKLAVAGGESGVEMLREVSDKKAAAAAYTMPEGFSTPSKY